MMWTHDPQNACSPARPSTFSRTSRHPKPHRAVDTRPGRLVHDTWFRRHVGARFGPWTRAPGNRTPHTYAMLPNFDPDIQGKLCQIAVMRTVLRSLSSRAGFPKARFGDTRIQHPLPQRCPSVNLKPRHLSATRFRRAIPLYSWLASILLGRRRMNTAQNSRAVPCVRFERRCPKSIFTGGATCGRWRAAHRRRQSTRMVQSILYPPRPKWP